MSSSESLGSSFRFHIWCFGWPRFLAPDPTDSGLYYLHSRRLKFGALHRKIWVFASQESVWGLTPQLFGAPNCMVIYGFTLNLDDYPMN